jgi:hypothetical protein
MNPDGRDNNYTTFYPVCQRGRQARLETFNIEIGEFTRKLASTMDPAAGTLIEPAANISL